MASKKITTDHEEIRHWAEEHDGRPAAISDQSRRGRDRVVNIFFPDQYVNDPIEEITWDEFFDKFEEDDLAFMYQAGDDSRLFRIVER